MVRSLNNVTDLGREFKLFVIIRGVEVDLSKLDKI